MASNTSIKSTPWKRRGREISGIDTITWNTIWKNDKITREHQHTRELSQQVITRLKVQTRQHNKDKRETKITKRIHKRSITLEQPGKTLQGLNMFNGTNLTLNSDVDKDTYMIGSHERSLTYRCLCRSNLKLGSFEKRGGNYESENSRKGCIESVHEN